MREIARDATFTYVRFEEPEDVDRVQIRSAPAAPESPVSLPESVPTHTTHTTSGVYPTNHESRYSSVVPVFPETGNPMPAARAVPRSNTPCRA